MQRTASGTITEIIPPFLLTVNVHCDGSLQNLQETKHAIWIGPSGHGMVSMLSISIIHAIGFLKMCLWVCAAPSFCCLILSSQSEMPSHPALCKGPQAQFFTFTQIAFQPARFVSLFSTLGSSWNPTWLSTVLVLSHSSHGIWNVNTALAASSKSHH